MFDLPRLLIAVHYFRSIRLATLRLLIRSRFCLQSIAIDPMIDKYKYKYKYQYTYKYTYKHTYKYNSIYTYIYIYTYMLTPPPPPMYPRFVLEILEISEKSRFLGLSVKDVGNRIDIWDLGALLSRNQATPSSGIRDNNLGNEMKEIRFRE